MNDFSQLGDFLYWESKEYTRSTERSKNARKLAQELREAQIIAETHKRREYARDMQILWDRGELKYEGGLTPLNL